MRALVFLGLTVISCGAQADACAELGDRAELVMGSRQVGLPLSQMMESASAYEEPERQTMERMLLEAYDEPQYRTPSNQKDSIARFRNKIELACYKAKAGQPE